MNKITLPETDTKEMAEIDCLHQDKLIRIEGRTPLHGSVRVQGSKNAVLPILAACLLIQGKCVIRNCPIITDVSYMLRLLECAGCEIEQKGNVVTIDALGLREYRLPGKYVRKMRSSVILIGAMLGRVQEVGIEYPGGCVIGERPIDLHLKGLLALGADIAIEGNYIHAEAKKLKGADIVFPFSSVGATQNVILASVLAEGETRIQNAAREPEIDTLCTFLRMAGADIEGIGTSRLVIRGVKTLHPIEYDVVSDRIVAGTYLLATAASRGSICLKEAPIEHMNCILQILRAMGCDIVVRQEQQEIELRCGKKIRNLPLVETDIYPGFPTDLQSLLLVTAITAEGELMLKESIFSGRFKIVEELRRMGAYIREDGSQVMISGGTELTGRNVIARELRGGAALVTAGIVAEGMTTIVGTCYINRGYEDIVRDFKMLGALIDWMDR
ncbi:MAG: UDP-N-acetylglucosamine 1-carboxyvinyltransferase [Lachnospiraceae bacterium]|nr:UDP-N-acetylglucosamine 1-carboxyvinyltransferase [Lachnospiraceae bacterium]